MKTTAQWAGANTLIVLLQDGHTDAEKVLRAAGYLEHCLEGRRILQTILEDELTATVRRITGRPVEAMLSATRLDPDLSAEIFMFAEQPVGEAHAATRTD